MGTRHFWIAAVGSGVVHLSAVGVLCAVALWPGFTLATMLEGYGDSDREGFPEITAVTMTPGTFRKGDERTPGGDDQPNAPLPEKPPAAEPPPPPPPEPVKSESKPAIPEPSPDVTPKPSAPRDKFPEPPPVEKPPEPNKTAEKRVVMAAPEAPTERRLPGKQGGSQFPVGSPSAGGTVGTPTGVRMLRGSRPIYPPEAEAAGLEGRPWIWALVSADGEVIEARVHRSCGHAILDEAALRWARSQRFIAAKLNGVPVEWPVIMPVRFDLP